MKHMAGITLSVVVALGSLVACSKNEEAAKKACAAAPPAITDTKLPTGFPTSAGTAYTASRTDGPTQVVDGYTATALTDTFEAFKADLAKAPFGITKSEHDAHDAEVNFDGTGVTGSVRLGEACSGRTSVLVKVRAK